MDKQELLGKISHLEQVANKMNEPDKTFKLNEVSKLRIAIDGMAIYEIAQKMQGIELSKIQEMDNAISLATKAISSQSERVNAFNKVYEIIKGVLKLVI